MRDYLIREGFHVNRKRVQRLMLLIGLESVAPKPNTSKPCKEHKVYPYLLRNYQLRFLIKCGAQISPTSESPMAFFTTMPPLRGLPPTTSSGCGR